MPHGKISISTCIRECDLIIMLSHTLWVTPETEAHINFFCSVLCTLTHTHTFFIQTVPLTSVVCCLEIFFCSRLFFIFIYLTSCLDNTLCPHIHTHSLFFVCLFFYCSSFSLTLFTFQRTPEIFWAKKKRTKFKWENWSVKHSKSF